MVREADVLFGKILVHNRLATQDQVQQCLKLKQQYASQGQSKPIQNVFIEQGIINQEQAKKVLAAQKVSLLMHEDKFYGQLAIKNGLVNQQQLNECLQQQKAQRYNKRIGEILKEKGYINEKQHRALMNAQQRVLKLRESKGEFSGITEVAKKTEVTNRVNAPSSPNPASSPSPQNQTPPPTPTPTPTPPPASGGGGGGGGQQLTTYEQKFAQLALQKNLINQQQLNECRHIKGKMAEMGIEKSLDHVIIEKNYPNKNALKKLQESLPIQSPIEGYEVQKKLGEGAMGTVYRARLKGTEEWLALKVLNPNHSDDSEFLRRFIREAQAARELDHPNIVRAFEVGVSGDYYYYSMEFVEGFSLKDLLDEGHIKEEKALEYAVHIASALEYAAERHIVHRDIKPENIIIDRNTGLARLCDMGIAKRLDQEMNLTKPGMAVGTPYFISPEQARGGKVDTRSDIYSLGATLFNMVAGEVPYDGENATQILIQHCTAAIPLASDRNSEVSGEFSQILAKTMAKKPEDRYQSPTELLTDLRNLQNARQGGGGGGGGNGQQQGGGQQEPKMQSPIESYEIQKVLGQGAMGIVYLANLEGQTKPLALKVLLPQVAEDKEFLKRFILEAQASIEFDHPNIVKAFEVGISGDYYYYSMDYVEGKSVKAVMEEDHGGKLPEPLALKITHDIAKALCYAHTKQVVHRDIKPENLMYTINNVAKLCDLGIAKQLSNDKGITQPGMAVGSPYYIAPEQARGAQVDSRTDIYALGASLFHMTTGSVPYEGYTAAAVMAKHVRDPVPDPIERNPELSQQVAGLITKMMQKKPEERYGSPMELKAELERIMPDLVNNQ